MRWKDLRVIPGHQLQIDKTIMLCIHRYTYEILYLGKNSEWELALLAMAARLMEVERSLYIYTYMTPSAWHALQRMRTLSEVI
jgi:hypothetical protein